MSPSHRDESLATAASLLAVCTGKTPAKCTQLIRLNPAEVLPKVAEAFRLFDAESPYAKDVELLQTELTPVAPTVTE